MSNTSTVKTLPLVPFKEMPYTRPDMKAIEKGFADALSKFKAAASVKEQIEAIDMVQAINREYSTMSSLASVRHTIDTRDEFYDKENDFYDEAGPLFSKLSNEFGAEMVKSKFRAELEKEFGHQVFDLTDLSLKVFSPEIMDDLMAENKLTSKYSKLIASAQIEFQGEKRTLSQLSPFMQDMDREVRKAAAKAFYGFFEENEAEFDSIYDELVKVRTKIAKKLGYKNFVQLAYDRLGRTEYNAEMVAKYRKQIYEFVVPIAQSLKKRQSKRLKLDKVYYYDTGLKYLTGNAVPQGEPDWIVEQAKKMYNELSPETSEFFKMMTDYGLMDLLSTKGKAGGGYCTGFPLYKVPFIFANFNKTQHDVEVMTHEAGHAFQAYQSRNARLLEYGWPTLEACEIHSMSMEFFTWPWMELFFKHQTDKFKFTHLSGAFEFLPYGATVDEFQHWVYENPEASPAERKAEWHKIELKYNPSIDYADNAYLNRGGFWVKQGHIFASPFYYIDYTLAQVCALQFWVKANADRKTAWEDYLRLCKAGGSLPFLELLKLANLKNPFEEGCIASVTPECEKWLNSIDDSKL
ncbi:M3 family oligoendopeptidase [Treponema denticola]|uniref:M3 family oligoendopeptidase n=1 Tax=Treponema denticola TaxID=158 RepID=UPI0020A4094D|nr:M3 family oligoendopeptidase [Treponema denticola]UTC91615.1 M3 family oligoendopeptidase [Treponema denticola]UTC96768.1 M3 family oligoendopeptidase [Treponema denticola]